MRGHNKYQNEKVCYGAQNIFMCIWCISTDKTHFLEEKIPQTVIKIILQLPIEEKKNKWKKM